MQKHLLSNCEAVEALKEEYDELNPTNPSHADWCKKRISNAVQFEGGLIYELEKPSIKKDRKQEKNMEFTAKIEIKNGEILITPESHNNSYMIFEKFIWENRDKKINDIINVLPF